MSSSLSTIVDNLPKGTYRIKCKYEHNNQNVRNVELNTKILSDLEYKNNLLLSKCFCSNRNYQKRFDENLKK